jgi:hypothetical protein
MSSWIRPEKRRHFRGKRGPNRPSAKLTAHASRTWRKAAAEGRWHQRGFRSIREGRLLRSLVWQWFCSESQSKCSMRKLARRLGCDKSWIIQLRRKFRANPEQQRKREELHGPATWAEFDEERNKRLSDLCRFSLYRQPRIRRKRPTKSPEQIATEKQVRAFLRSQRAYERKHGSLDGWEPSVQRSTR